MKMEKTTERKNGPQLVIRGIPEDKMPMLETKLKELRRAYSCSRRKVLQGWQQTVDVAIPLQNEEDSRAMRDGLVQLATALTGQQQTLYQGRDRYLIAPSTPADF